MHIHINYKIYLALAFILVCNLHVLAHNKKNTNGHDHKISHLPWVPDNRNGTYSNPVIHADYSDPDVIRVGNDYFLTASSFVHTPGLPILHSKDLVNWTIVNHAVPNIPYGNFEKPMHGNGIWAPSIRYHNGEYYIYYGDPDYGIFMTKTKDPYGKWEPLAQVCVSKGWIDACPLWDDDGNAYLVHAWARSRSGIKHRLTIHKMSVDGTKLLDSGITVYENPEKHNTIEGPKFYKRNGFYYIFAPAGGVPTGWQTILRSKKIYGPYEDRIVLEQGTTAINGPHQGGWVETPEGDSWFLHFQDKDAYGRIEHLQPMKWVNDWPEMGIDKDSNGIGEPVQSCTKPVSSTKHKVEVPQTSDEFNSSILGLQWQWEANHSDAWYSLNQNHGNLRLFSQSLPSDTSRLWDIPNIIGQKFPAEDFTVTTKVHFEPKAIGEKTGLVIFGMDYAALTITKKIKGYVISKSVCTNAPGGGKENIVDEKPAASTDVFFRVKISKGALAQFSYSMDGKIFYSIGKVFAAKKGQWVGAKIGLFSTAPNNSKHSGYADYDWFRVSK